MRKGADKRSFLLFFLYVIEVTILTHLRVMNVKHDISFLNQ